MTKYDQLRDDAITALGKHLTGKGISPADVSQILDALQGTSLPGFLAFLGTSKQPKGDVGQSVLRRVAERVAEVPAVKQSHLDADDVERMLTAVFAHGASPATLLTDPTVRDVVLHAAVEQFAKQAGVPLTPDQAKEAVQLLITGAFFRDAASTLGAAAFAVRELPIDLMTDVRNAPDRLVALLIAIAQDLAGTPFLPVRILDDLKDDGKLDHPPAVMRHTMACLLKFATLQTTAHTLGELIKPDNRSVRLAIVAYARANGIPLEDSDLDLVRNNLLETPNPDLGPLLVAAFDRYVANSGQGQLLTALRQVAGNA